MTRFLRIAALAVGAVTLSVPLLAQTPTPTPTATPTPTPTPVPTIVPASVGGLEVPDGGRYDAANMVFDADGTIWSGSANENVLIRISADETKVRKWTMPKDAAPSYLLKEPDGKFWVAQLGGFKVSLFNPETAELTEWADTAHRPTAFVKKADGTLWLPETNGTLTNFAPSSGTFVYWRSTDTAHPISSLTYPYLDGDGSVWSADFLRGTLIRYTPDGAKATIWTLPDTYAQPSKIIRGPDGELWMSLYGAGQLARFDPDTGLLERFDVGTYTLPFDLKVYKDRIAYTEQQGGEVGVFDPRGTPPSSTSTLESAEVSLTSTTEVATPVTSVLVSKDLDVTVTAPVAIQGAVFPGNTRYSAVGGVAYALQVDDVRKRFLVGGPSTIVEVLPPVPAATTDQYFPAAASVAGRGGTRWATQVVVWNRGSADTTTGATVDASVDARLLPMDWIVGVSPGTTLTAGAGKIVSEPDPIKDRMGAPGMAGSLRISTAPGSTTTKFADVYSWTRVYTRREDGGTLGFARNSVLAEQGIGAGEAGSILTPADPASYRVNAGLLVVEKAVGKVSVVDAAGAALGRGPITFSWPAGYQAQASTIFDAFGIPPAPSARIVFELTKGRVLPFGIAIDSASDDPIDLPVFGPRSTALYQWVLGVERGGGPLGPTSRTDLQLFNPASTDSTVSIGFRAARLASATAPPPVAAVSLTVPAGRVLDLHDVVKERFGLENVAGSMDVVSDPPVVAFATVTAEDSAGGRHGYGIPALLGNSASAVGSRGVFIQATDAGWDVMESELQVTNPTDGPAQVAVRAYDADGAAAGQALTLSVGAKEVVRVPVAFYTTAGFGAPIGRLEVVPQEGSQPVFATLVRQDKKTGDADAVVPYVVPSS